MPEVVLKNGSAYRPTRPIECWATQVITAVVMPEDFSWSFALSKQRNGRLHLANGGIVGVTAAAPHSSGDRELAGRSVGCHGVLGHHRSVLEPLNLHAGQGRCEALTRKFGAY